MKREINKLQQLLAHLTKQMEEQKSTDKSRKNTEMDTLPNVSERDNESENGNEKKKSAIMEENKQNDLKRITRSKVNLIAAAKKNGRNQSERRTNEFPLCTISTQFFES